MSEELNYIQLTQKREQLIKEIEEIDKKINGTPEVIRKYFKLLKDGEFKDLLVSKIVRIEHSFSGSDNKKCLRMPYQYITFETIDGEFWKILWTKDGWPRDFELAGPCDGFDDEDLYVDIDFSIMKKYYNWSKGTKDLQEFLQDLLKIREDIIDGHFLAAAIFNACDMKDK